MGVSLAGYDVNVAGVRMVYQRRRIREHPHAEFILCTKRPGKEDVYVARRYGTFRKLYHDVRNFVDVADDSYVKNIRVRIFLVYLQRTKHRLLLLHRSCAILSLQHSM